MKKIDTLRYIFLKPKLWKSVFILFILGFALITVITINFIHTITDEVRILDEKKVDNISTLTKTKTLQELSSVESTLYSVRSIIEQHKLTTDFTHLLSTAIKNANTITSLIIFNKYGEVLYKSDNLKNINISKKDYYFFHKNSLSDSLHISFPSVSLIKNKYLFNVTLAIHDEKDEFGGVILARINSNFFNQNDLFLRDSYLKLAVKSTRKNMNYYGVIPTNSSIKNEFIIEKTPFKFVLYEEESTLSIFSYINNIMSHMKNILIIWGSFSFILIVISLYLLKRQFKISKAYMHLSNYDPLTQVYNRRAFMDHLKQECSRSHRYQKDLAVIMIDIDYFKSINDQYGHTAGDDVLKQFSSLLKDITRESDIFARLGGEEFAILLPETDLEGAIIAAEKYRKSIENYSFSTDSFIGMCTASFGVTALSELLLMSQEEQIELIMTLADKELYEAKINRNCVRPMSTIQP